MKAIISYEYSKLDKQHEIFIECSENWVWFQLGALLQKEGIEQKAGYLMIYPYVVAEKIWKIIEKDDCDSIAEELVRFIKRKTKQLQQKQ